MNTDILPVIVQIKDRFGEQAFYNMGRINALLLDLAPGMKRERILARSFVEIGGYKALQSSGHEYHIIKNNLIKGLCEAYCMDACAARFIVHIFGAALGMETDAIPPTKETAYITPARGALVALGKAHAAAVAADGTVFAGGANTHYQCDTKGWREIVAVAAGDSHTLGLRSDGTLRAAGSNLHNQCDIAAMVQVASVYAFGNETLCVHTDGSVSATGQTTYDLSAFADIQSLARSPEGILGIRQNGTVTASSSEWDDEIKWVLDQQDVAQVIATYINGVILLKKDGRLYKNDQPANYFAPWRDIVAMVDAADCFAVLRSDGAVRILPYSREKTRVPCDAEHWESIVALYGKYKRLIGLTADGRLLSASTDPEWQKRNGSFDFVKAWMPIGSI